MSASTDRSLTRSLRVSLALLLAFAQAWSSSAAYALKAEAPTQTRTAVGLEERLRDDPGTREHYIHTLEQVVVADRLAMTVIPNHDAPASRVAIAEPDDETTFMLRKMAAASGGQRLRFVDLATGRSQPINAPEIENPKALGYHNDVLYVAQSEGRVHRFDVPHNQWLPAWTLTYEVADSDATGGRRSVRLAQPGGIAVDGRRRILYVADSEAGRIAGFQLLDGSFTGFLIAGLSVPEDVVVGPHPTDSTKTALYVADRLRSTVFAYDAETAAPLAFSIPNLANPARLAIDPEHRLLFVVSGHAGFLGGFSLDTVKKVELKVPKTAALRHYYEEHAADIDVDLRNAVDVVYDPHTKAIILATHQRLIPFWVVGQSLRLTPPATGLEESPEKAEDLRALRDLLETEGRVFNGSDEVRWSGPRLIASVTTTEDRKVQLSIQGAGGRVLNHLAGTRITIRGVEDRGPGVTKKLESPRALDEVSSSEVTATFPQEDRASVSYQFLLARTGLEERVLQGPNNLITVIQFVNNGAALMAVDEGGQVASAWRLGPGTSLIAKPTYFLNPPEGKSASVAAISADGGVVACGDRGVTGDTAGGPVTRGAIWLHRYELTTMRWRPPARVFGPVTRLAVDGARRFAAATGGAKPGIQLVSETAVGRSTGVEAPVTALAFNPTGTLLVAGTQTGRLYVWQVPGDTVELSDHNMVWTDDTVESAISSVALAPGGRVVAGLLDGRVQVRAANGAVEQTLTDLLEPVTTLAVRRDGTVFAGAGRRVWRWGPDAVQGERAITDRPGPVRQLVLSPDSNTLAVVVDQHVHRISLPPLPVAPEVAADGASLLPATGLEEPMPEQRQAEAVAALETLQRAAGAARVNVPTDRFYFLRGDAVALAPAFERLGLRFLVRADTMVAAKALLDLGVPADRIAGATSPELPAEWYSMLKITRAANAAWGDRRFLEAVRRPMEPWTFESALVVQRTPDSDPAWIAFWRDWPLPDAVRAQLTPAVQATEGYFQAMG